MTGALLRGSWRSTLCTHWGFEWLASDVALQLIDAPTADHLQKLSVIVGSVLERAHLQYWFQHIEGTRSHIPSSMAWVTTPPIGKAML
eukprot:5689749-Amphidinium_carterae.1